MNGYDRHLDDNYQDALEDARAEISAAEQLAKAAGWVVNDCELCRECAIDTKANLTPGALAVVYDEDELAPGEFYYTCDVCGKFF
jgi:hypothetical protein